MKNRSKGLLVVVFAVIIIMCVWNRSTYYDKTDFREVTSRILDADVDGFAVSLSEVISLRENELFGINTETDFANGPLPACEINTVFVDQIIGIFSAIEEMEQVNEAYMLSDTGYYHVWMNVDFTKGKHSDEPHSLVLLIDNESYDIIIPQIYDMYTLENISQDNRIRLRPSEDVKNTIIEMIESADSMHIDATEPVYSLDQDYGVAMVFLEYASDSTVIFRGHFGLFVYDLETQRIVRSVDLSKINCNQIQGSDACMVSVDEGGNFVEMHRATSDTMYVYDIENNWFKRSIYEPMENSVRLFDTYEMFDVGDYLVSGDCVRFSEHDYGYLRTDDYTIETLQYVRGDDVYYLFGDGLDGDTYDGNAYLIHAAGDGWLIDNLKVRFDTTGYVVEFSGEMEMNKAFEYYNLEIYQIKDQIRHSLYYDSYSLVDGVKVSVDFSKKDLADEKFDPNKELLAEIRMIDDSGEEKTVVIDVVSVETEIK